MRNYEEYVPKGQSVIWKLFRNLAIICALFLAVLYLERGEFSEMTIGSTALVWSFVGVPLLLIGAAFRR